MPLPEPISLELEAIDAALAGDAVDPEFADLAELALLLAGNRPELPEDASTRLDRRVSALASTPQRARRPWIFRPAFGAGLAAAAAVAVVVVVLTGAFSSAPARETNAFLPRAQHLSGSAAKAGSARSAGAGSAGSVATQGVQGAASSSASSASSAPSPALAPAPAPSGQRTVQSDQLQLTAPPSRINAVSQELFNVVAAEQGIVKHSSISSGLGADSSFTLAIPSGNLSAAMNRLEQLRYAKVSYSTASTDDVNSQYVDDERRLTDEETFHNTLLRELADASSASDAEGLNTKIAAVEMQITTLETTLDTLKNRISYSSVNVTIFSATPGSHHTSGGFSFGRAGHDALHVLVVVAGVALIALAVLVPLTLLVALIAWVGFGWRRRRRESVLDGA